MSGKLLMAFWTKKPVRGFVLLKLISVSGCDGDGVVN